jgi:AcrR family transcriptional regulator
MAKTEPGANAEPADEPVVSWRELAVTRSLGSARTRAENRVQRYLDAALELMNEGGPGKDFTVQEVVERSGQSLRSFYQYFGGKHELLLALFEESVRSTTELLREDLADEADATGRLHRFVVEYYQLCRPAPKGSSPKKAPKAPVMVDFAQQLLTGHPTEAAMAFAPLVSLFGELLDEAAAEGAIRPGLRRSPIAGMILEAIMFNAFSVTIGGTSATASVEEQAEELWDLVLNGIGVPAGR